MAITLKPLSDRIVVQPAASELKTKGGIILPETADKERPVWGEVVVVGPGKLDKSGKRAPVDVKKGDRVYFSQWSGTEVKIDEVKYLILKEEDILAVE